MNIKEGINKLSTISTAFGLIMKTGQNNFMPIKLAYQPYLITKEEYLEMEEISRIWQKLLFLASKDDELIKNTFSSVAKVDEMIANIYQIYLKSCLINRKDSICLARTDYFKNTVGEFKIIQYNLFSVSMAQHSQNFTKARKTLQKTFESKDQYQYPENKPCQDIGQCVAELYRLKNLKGIFLMIVSSKQKNIVDQTCVQIKLMQNGIKTKRQNLCCLYYKIQKIDNKIFYQGQQISVVYYRTGYQPTDYCEDGKFNQCWQAKQRIQLSQVIKIPDIKMELMNQKRMQVQLSKEQIHRKYLTEQQIKILNRSLVFTIDFENNPLNIDYIKLFQQKGRQNFILKPNLEGGGNNIYGHKAYQMIKSLSKQQLKKYILMEKIVTHPIQNQIFSGQVYANVKCICQLSRYGILLQIDGKLVKNSSDGYLIRVKPQTSNQGGVMAGVGAVASIAFQK